MRTPRLNSEQVEANGAGLVVRPAFLWLYASLLGRIVPAVFHALAVAGARLGAGAPAPKEP